MVAGWSSAVTLVCLYPCVSYYYFLLLIWLAPKYSFCMTSGCNFGSFKDPASPNQLCIIPIWLLNTLLFNTFDTLCMTLALAPDHAVISHPTALPCMTSARILTLIKPLQFLLCWSYAAHLHFMWMLAFCQHLGLTYSPTVFLVFLLRSLATCLKSTHPDTFWSRQQQTHSHLSIAIPVITHKCLDHSHKGSPLITLASN